MNDLPRTRLDPIVDSNEIDTCANFGAAGRATVPDDPVLPCLKGPVGKGANESTGEAKDLDLGPAGG